jgi:hypothetical protein
MTGILSARSLPALGLAGVAGLLSALGLTGLASVVTRSLSTLGLTSVTGRLAALGLTGTCVAGGLVAVSPAGVTSLEARLGTGLFAAAAAAFTPAAPATAAVSRAYNAGRCRRMAPERDAPAAAAQLDVEIELVVAARRVRARDGACGRDLRVFPDEDLCAAEASEWRFVRRELIAVDDVLFPNLDARAHVERRVEQPVSLFRAATQ